jgi:hypothetical protein
VARAASEAEAEREIERDYFVPIIVATALAAYAVTALIAWLEYQQ